MKHDMRSWKGCVPKAHPERLPLEVPKAAINCDFSAGVFSPIAAPAATGFTCPKAGEIKSLYRYRLPRNGSLSDKWLHWTAVTSAVRSPLREDADKSIYFADGSHGLRETNATLAVDGLDPEQNFNYPVNWKAVGVPQGTSPIAAAGGDTEGLKRIYTYTFVAGLIEDSGVISNYGFEGAPAPQSNVVFYDDQLDEGQVHTDIVLTLPTSAPAGAIISHLNIYRLEEDGEFHRITTVPIGTLTVTDNGLVSDRVLETYDFIPAPDDLNGLTLLESGCLAGFSGKEVCITPPYVVYAWPERYRFKCESPVVALVATRAGILVGTETKPYTIGGYDPESMTKIAIETNEPCKSARSMVDMGEYAMYAGATGLVMVTPGAAKVITNNLLSEDQWRALEPDAMHGVEWNGKYLCFTTRRTLNAIGSVCGFIFDPRNGELIFHDVYATASYRDPESQQVFFVDGDTKAVSEFAPDDRIAGNLVAYLATGENDVPIRRMIFFKVTCSGNTTVTFNVDGQRAHQVNNVMSGKIYRLPPAVGRLWSYSISSSGEVSRFVVSSNPQGLL